MKVLFVKNLCLVNGYGREFNYERMKGYSLPDKYALDLIEQGYCVRFGMMGEKYDEI